MNFPLKPKTDHLPLKDRIDLDLLLSHKKRKDEKVRWVGTVQHIEYFSFDLLLMIGVFLALSSGATVEFKLNIPIYALIIGVIVITLPLHYFIKSRKRTMVVTNHRILYGEEEYGINELDYLYLEGDYVIMKDGFENFSGTLKFKHKDKAKLIYNEIKKGKSEFVIRQEKARTKAIEKQKERERALEKTPKRQTSISYPLEQKGFTQVKESLLPVYEGEINDLEYQVAFNSNKVPIQSIEITVEVANIEDNFLLIYSQNHPVVFSDIIIGDELFDRTFVIQSNDNKFLNTVLTKRAKQHLLACHSIANCQIQFGEKQNIDKEKGIDNSSKFTDQEDVLDFQLLDTNSSNKETTNNTEKSTTLTLHCLPDSNTKNNVDLLEGLVDNCLSSMLELGKSIQENNLG